MSVEPSAAAVLVVPASTQTLDIAVDLPKDVESPPSAFGVLYEIDGTGMNPAQFVPAMGADGRPSEKARRLVARIYPRDGAKGVRRFRLEFPKWVDPPRDEHRFKDLNDRSVGLYQGDRPVLVYNHGMITGSKVPKQDHRRQRACYIHPLYGLDGETLTDDFPSDHYHHHGVFWTWPHVRVGDKNYDSWQGPNIYQRLVKFLAREAGGVAGVLAVENGWFVPDEKATAKGAIKSIMTERVWLRAYRNCGDDEETIDLEFTWIPTELPITLRGAEGKSYGGLAMRFAVEYTKKKEVVITVPTGVAKDDLPDTPLPWADLTTTVRGAKAPSGAAIFIPKSHPDYPPTWLTRHYGPLSVGWPGVKDRTFEPGKPIRLSYRIWIHRGNVDVEKIRAAYAAYLAAAGVKWE